MTRPLPFPPQRAWIVAELSANHGGSLERAIDTVHQAARAGADAIKIQTYTPDSMTLDCDREEFRIRGGPWNGRTLYDLYREAHTPWEWHAPLLQAAAEEHLPLFSTPFDPAAVDRLETLGVPFYKVASFEITDLELLDRIALTQKPILVSTGMAGLAEIDQAVRRIRKIWSGQNPGLCLLKCVSAYPADPKDMNLATIPHLASTFDAVPGLSDHTLGTAVSVAAVALGARVIERHFTLQRSDGGPDSAFSLEPDELRRLVRDVREAEVAIGQVRYGPSSKGEEANTKFRRSIFVVQDVASGETFTRQNVRVIRPADGLAPSMLPLVLGRTAKRALKRGTPLSLEMIG